MTVIVFGILGKDNAPVDDTIIFSSISTLGIVLGSDPDAMTIFLASCCFVYLIFLGGYRGPPFK